MKTNHMKYLVAGFLIALTSIGANAQDGDTASPATGPASGAGAVSDAKAAKAADRALQKAVMRALSKTKGLRVSTISVRARNGVVTLEGQVPEQSQAELATKVAEGVQGVKQVKNALTLSSI
ncbi:BON domain-containing protein [Paraburkholderia sp. A1RI-2L]|uniref:BON domain-containing protein n=1 Tax=Paraburkholderia sp. A1RI-2L TaxID=3028367 RepID=UPI003B778C33